MIPQYISPTDDSKSRLFIDSPLFDLNPSSFSLEIERVVKETPCNYIEAICQLCDRYEIDFTAVPKLLTETMKDKVEMNAIDLRMMKQ